MKDCRKVVRGEAPASAVSCQPVLLQSRNPERVLESTANTMPVTEQNMAPRSMRNGIHSWHSLVKLEAGVSGRCQPLKNSVEDDLGANKRYHKILIVASHVDTLDIVEYDSNVILNRYIFSYCPYLGSHPHWLPLTLSSYPDPSKEQF